MRLANFNLTTQAPAAHLSLRRASLHAISHTAYLSPYGDPGIELTWLGLYTLGQLSQAWPSTQACTNSARMRDDDLAITAAPATRPPSQHHSPCSLHVHWHPQYGLCQCRVERSWRPVGSCHICIGRRVTESDASPRNVYRCPSHLRGGTHWHWHACLAGLGVSNVTP